MNCPWISRGQWHPFTITSAQDDPMITLHIKIQGRHSWTRELVEYLSILGPPNSSYFELARVRSSRQGKIV